MECVQLLADILVPADKLESPFAFLQYNDKQSAQNRDLILDSQLLQGGVNLNLPTVYIITSGTTAGAAEMLINCLKPYMKVVLIGQTTKGEYVATETFINPKYPGRYVRSYAKYSTPTEKRTIVQASSRILLSTKHPTCNTICL